ncbi:MULTISPECIES: Sec-independent protein translocase protein TatB [unclassified Polynucleobacter]|jgi:sec-independent protein translocase protein TatB|uniref:Sec-independent protein translocase protein TatB n=1 Tax=unclassified Polynucleobacter TaxID=2640945 RepID=UPI00092CA62E|nr:MULTISPECIES: Sec-independent protein translocase protein TatB [unclassified Polynucleobacter]MBU3562677.1 Sec-independent protein translocase subunit TatB [Polynucleobacter sp. Tro8-14-1]MBU3638331.1 Sec-independent protein translocase subunit TatB [Polynucleobacter sp. AP-RePozz3-80-G7]MEA9568354.1 Sec-independent protein translocase protein TatB [Polynucleobacter sp. AP-Nickl1-40-C4]OJI06137.1 twin arginine-targeting protein translocase TatB [Polynucleobacter sp. MWH-Adler-W8]QWD81730.1 
MIDLGVSKLALIAVVALVVVGPERLPKVARMAGNLFGRAQRYMADVKSEVSRQMEVEEFKKFREETAATLKEVENSIGSTVQEASANLSDQADIFETSFDKPPLDEKEVLRKTKRQGRNSWGVRRAARPLWFKRSAGIRTRVQSGAARMKRFHHSAGK